MLAKLLRALEQAEEAPRRSLDPIPEDSPVEAQASAETKLLVEVDALLDEVPRARESGNVIGVARANAVARWLIHVACFSGFEELHDAIVDIAQVRCPR